MTINLSVPVTHDLKPRLTVMGVGGAGCNAVNNMITAHLEGVDFVVPGNDDAIKSITLFSEYFSSAVAEGSKGVKKDSGESSRDVSLEKEILEKYEKDVELKMED